MGSEAMALVVENECWANRRGWMVMLVTGESRQGPSSEVLLAMATARVVEQGAVYSRAQSIVGRNREGRSQQTV